MRRRPSRPPWPVTSRGRHGDPARPAGAWRQEPHPPARAHPSGRSAAPARYTRSGSTTTRPGAAGAPPRGTPGAWRGSPGGRAAGPPTRSSGAEGASEKPAPARPPPARPPPGPATGRSAPGNRRRSICTVRSRLSSKGIEPLHGPDDAPAKHGVLHVEEDAVVLEQEAPHLDGSGEQHQPRHARGKLALDRAGAATHRAGQPSLQRLDLRADRGIACRLRGGRRRLGRGRPGQHQGTRRECRRARQYDCHHLPCSTLHRDPHFGQGAETRTR